MGQRIDVDELKRQNPISTVVRSIGGIELKKTKNHLYLGLCPFHEDSTPSMQVDDQHQNFHCFACGAKGDAIAFVQKLKGCSFMEAVKILGAEPAREASKVGRSAAPAADMVEKAVYDYQDESGKTIFQVVRLEGDDGKKTFRQRRFSQTGETIYNLQGVKRVVYRLPEVIEGIANGDTIYILEGEKDVQTAQSLGLVATCNPMGAGKWLPEYAEQLRGADHIVIVSDRDEPGRAHAQQVYDSLVGYAQCVDISEPRQGKDFTDHIEAGLKLEDLRRVKVGLRWTKLSTVKTKPINWLWYPWLARGKFALIQGDPGEGKSSVCRAVAASLTIGQGLPGVPDRFEPMDVILLCGEEDNEDTVAPHMARLGANLDRVSVLSEGQIQFDPAGIRQLEARIAQTGAGLIVADPLISMFNAKRDLHRQNEVRETMNEVINLCKRTGVVIWGLVHLNKQGGTSKALYRAIGSIDFPAVARTAMMCGHDPDDERRRAIALFKSNIGPTGIAWGYTIEEDGAFYWLQQSDLTADRMSELPQDKATQSQRREVGDWLRFQLASGAVRQTAVLELASHAGYSSRTLQRAKREIGVVSGKIGRGEGAWYWALNTEDWVRFKRALVDTKTEQEEGVPGDAMEI